MLGYDQPAVGTHPTGMLSCSSGLRQTKPEKFRKRKSVSYAEDVVDKDEDKESEVESDSEEEVFKPSRSKFKSCISVQCSETFSTSLIQGSHSDWKNGKAFSSQGILKIAQIVLVEHEFTVTVM